jgi:hypothetical protein
LAAALGAPLSDLVENPFAGDSFSAGEGRIGLRNGAAQFQAFVLREDGLPNRIIGAGEFSGPNFLLDFFPQIFGQGIDGCGPLRHRMQSTMSRKPVKRLGRSRVPAPHVRSTALVLLVLIASLPARGDDGSLTVRQSPFAAGQYDLYEGGKRTGTVRENPFRKGELDVYDSRGRRQETIRPNPFQPDGYDILRDGERAGTVRRNPFDSDRYDVLDRTGERRGTVERSPFDRDEWRFEPRK